MAGIYVKISSFLVNNFCFRTYQKQLLAYIMSKSEIRTLSHEIHKESGTVFCLFLQERHVQSVRYNAKRINEKG